MRSLSRMTLLHLTANALLLGVGYYWLGIRESQTSTLLESVFLALILTGLTCWTYGAPFAYFQTEPQREAISAWRATLGRLVPLAVAACAIAVIYWLIEQWAEYSGQPAFKIASYLTLKVRTPVRPASVARVFNILTWLLRWAVLPVLLLPVCSAIVARGWTGFRAIGAGTCRWIYWLEVPVLLLCVVWIPRKLLAWVPLTEGFGLEMASFLVRAAVAYLLFCVAWLALAFVTSEGNPRFTQSSIEVSP
jgi:hypothetical protein